MWSMLKSLRPEYPKNLAWTSWAKLEVDVRLDTRWGIYDPLLNTVYESVYIGTNNSVASEVEGA